MELSELKLYLRVDHDEEDTLITGMKDAAEAYLLNAGVMQTYPNKLYELAVKVLVTHWYENRGAVLVGVTSKELEISLKGIIMQLKYTSEVVL